MTPASVSFRITRSTEDLAHTTHALSLRLLKLEQRLEALELQLEQAVTRREQPDLQELGSLENVERLLYDCRSLLGLDEETEVDATDVAASTAGEGEPMHPDGTDPEVLDHPEAMAA